MIYDKCLNLTDNVDLLELDQLSEENRGQRRSTLVDITLVGVSLQYS